MDKNATVLFVDDEERILRSLKMLFRNRCQVLTATDGNVALDLLRRQRVHVIVSDQRMPNMTGIELLRQVRAESPNTMRLLLTGYSDMAAVVDSVNEGEIFRYLTKPWNAEEIISAVSRAAGVAMALQDVQVNEADTPSAPGVLVMDDDPTVAELVRSICGPARPVTWSMDLDEAFEILSNNDIAIVICDIRLRGRDISAALKMLKETNPDVLTIVQTQLQDVDVISNLINHGQIYRYLPKPARRGILEMSLQSASRRHAALRSAPALRKRYAVEANSAAQVNGLSGRLMGYLEKMRQRVML
ncbi:MAG: response regulator [Gammaproteobacteria bacterium]